jgi:hypothetical protein
MTDHSKATPRPWKSVSYRDNDTIQPAQPYVAIQTADNSKRIANLPLPGNFADAFLIVDAVNAFDLLTEENDRLVEENKRLRDALDKIGYGVLTGNAEATLRECFDEAERIARAALEG